MKTDADAMIVTGTIKLNKPQSDFSHLICPRCDSPNLHQVDVISFDRGEDNETILRTETGAGFTRTEVVMAAGSGTPSSRRQGLIIRFDCESCGSGSARKGELMELTIGQHKGETEVAWRFNLTRLSGK